MALTISTPYKTNTLASTSSTTFTSNGTPFVGGDVGRFLVMTNGPAIGQVRKIVGYVSSSVVTLDYAFNVSPLASRGFTEVYPSAGNTWVMSWTLEELANGVELINSNGNIRQPWAGPAITVASGVFIAQCDRSIYLNADLFSLAFGSYLQFGHISSSGTPINGVMFEDGSTASPGGWSSGGYSGNLRIYGSRIRASGGGFWRLYSGATAYHRMIGNIISGNFGMRMMGSQSILADNVVDSDTSSIGPWHPATPIGLVSNNTVREGLSAAYINYGWLDAVIKGTRTSKVSYYVSVSLGAPNRAGNEYVEDFVESEITACVGGAILSADTQSGGSGAYFRFSNYIDTALVDSSLGSITDYARRVIRNGAGATVDNTTSNTGSFARYIALRKTFDFAVTGVSKSWASGVESGPYVQGICCYGYQPITLTMPLATSSNLTLTLLDDLNITESVRATVQAYGSLANLDQLYDAYKSWLVTNFATPWPTFGTQRLTGQGTTLDCGDANIVVDGTAAAAFAANTGTNTITIKASALAAGTKFIKLVTSGAISFVNGASPNTNLIYQDSTGLYVVLSVASLSAGSRVQLYNVTDATEIFNGVVAGTSYAQFLAYTADKTIRLRATKITGTTGLAPYEATGTLTANGLAFTAAQVSCPVYDSYGIDGSTVTGFAADYTDDEVDLTVAANFYIMNLFAWWCYNLTTAQGISDFFGGITPVDEGNIQVNDSIVSIYLDNTTSTDVWALDNRRFFRADGARPVKNPTTGGGGIDVEWREKVLFVNEADIAAIKAKTDNLPSDPAGVSDLPAEPDNAGISAIKAKTDSLAFTFSGQVDANIKAVNGYAVTGNGQGGTEWGPA